MPVFWLWTSFPNCPSFMEFAFLALTSTKWWTDVMVTWLLRLFVTNGLCLDIHYWYWKLDWSALVNGLNIGCLGTVVCVLTSTVVCVLTYTTVGYSGSCLNTHFTGVQWFVSWHMLQWGTVVYVLMHISLGSNGLCLDIHYSGVQWFMSWCTLHWGPVVCVLTYSTVGYSGSCLWHTLHWGPMVCVMTFLEYSGLCLDIPYGGVQWFMSWHTLHWGPVVCVVTDTTLGHSGLWHTLHRHTVVYYYVIHYTGV